MARRSKGEGTLYQLPNGTWRARIVIDGETITRDRTNRAAATEALDDLREYADAGIAPKEWTVRAWLEHWIDHIDNRDANTRKGYRLLLTPAVYPAIGRHKLDKLRPEHIERMYASMRAGTHRPPKRRANGTEETVRPLAESSILKVHRVLNRAMKTAVQRGQTLRNPLDHVTPPKTQRPHTASLSQDDAARVMRQAVADGEGARWALALTLGIRPGEALGLSWDMIDGDQLHIRQQLQQLHGESVTLKRFTKTVEGMRTLDLPDIVVRLLQVQRERQMQWMIEEGELWETWTPPGEAEPLLMVFTDRRGHPVRPRLDAERWRRLLERAGVPYQRPYAGRHTAASLMIANGVDAATVAAQLGHTDASFTMRTYVHPLRDRQKAASDLMGELFS